MLDSDIRRVLDRFSRTPSPYPPDIGALRAAAEEAPRIFGGAPEAVYAVDDLRAPGSAGPIPIRAYRPRSSARLPLFVFAHGGGWVAGSLDSHDRLCRILANRLDAVLVAVDYRLAPEHVYPAALD